MEIQINTDNSISGTASMIDEMRERLEDRLSRRFGSRLTRLEVHIRDIDGDSNRSDGVEAQIEARPANGDPVSVSERAGDPMQAFNAALVPLVARLSTLFGKRERVRG